MGRYINQTKDGSILPVQGKAQVLIADGAKVVDGKTFVENMVAVVENADFDASIYIYDEREYERVTLGREGRKVTYMVYDAAKNAED